MVVVEVVDVVDVVVGIEPVGISTVDVAVAAVAVMSATMHATKYRVGVSTGRLSGVTLVRLGLGA